MVFNQKHVWHLWHTCVSPCKIGSMDFYTSTRKKKISMTFGKILAKRSKQRAWDLWAWVWREWEREGGVHAVKYRRGGGIYSKLGPKTNFSNLRRSNWRTYSNYSQATGLPVTLQSPSWLWNCEIFLVTTVPWLNQWWKNAPRSPSTLLQANLGGQPRP